MMGPTIGLIPPEIERPGLVWDEELESYEGWAKYNRHYWLHDWRDFLEFFVGEIFSEPHSTKQIEDSVAYGLDTTPEVIVVAQESSHNLVDRENAERMLRDLRCPVVVAHGTDDHIIPFERGVNVAALAGGDFVELRGSGHALQARQPVQIDLLLRELAERVGGRPPRRRTWARSLARTKRALLVSSPIGLGHAWRDVAIADELRRRVPGLEIHWLAQHPVTTVLERRGETIHPASWELAPESEHIDREAGEHDLHAFQAIRRMDEILCANFMLFHDVVRDEQYDVWIGDEAWELDHFLHENPELKTAPYVWLSDFVGFLPMPSGGEHEAFLTADYNAEMIEHIARYPRVRDLALFVGDPEDIVPETFGPDLPPIRDWTEQHFRFAGYIPGFDPATVADRAALRAELGYDDEPFCVVSVGGSGVGAPLLHRVVECLPPDLRTLVVTGPRIDPDTVPRRDNVEARGYVHELYRHLAACDVAVVQGGLTTTMELVAAQRPFVSIPLASHFEQRFHVRHRLERYGATTRLDYGDITPATLGATLAEVGACETRRCEVDGRPWAVEHLERCERRFARALLEEGKAGDEQRIALQRRRHVAAGQPGVRAAVRDNCIGERGRCAGGELVVTREPPLDASSLEGHDDEIARCVAADTPDDLHVRPELPGDERSVHGRAAGAKLHAAVCPLAALRKPIGDDVDHAVASVTG